MDSVDSLLSMFCIQFSPQDWRIFQHAGEAAFDGLLARLHKLGWFSHGDRWVVEKSYRYAQ